jgi:hypothetical protein
MPIGALLLSAAGTVGYDALKAAIARRFEGDPDDLTSRLARALDTAIGAFFTVYGAKFPSATRSFLGRPENLSVIGNSLHYSQRPLSARDLDPRGLDGGPEATPAEVEHFVRLFTAEVSKDRFLDKHLRDRDHMREAAEHHAETKEMRALIERALRLVEAQAKTQTIDLWKDLVVKDDKHPSGWKPQQGQIYASRLPDGGRIEFMLHGDVISVQYTFSDGGEWYFDADSHGNTANQKFPYPLSEYRVVVPSELVLREEVREQPGGLRQVTKVLKWGNVVQYVLDTGGKLQEFHVAKGAYINHRERIIGVPAPQRQEAG